MPRRYWGAICGEGNTIQTRSSHRPGALLAAMLAVLLLSCTPGSDRATQPSPGQANSPAQGRTLVVLNRAEYATLAPKVLQSNGPLGTTRLFNASLSLIDDAGLPRPYLVETLPQLDTDSWRVSPDGRMETTYTLRSNLTWQDGAPLTADDFAFAFRVYKDPQLGIFIAEPQDAIDAVLAPDPRTIVVQWRALNPIGGSLTFGDLDPLPRHLLEAAFNDYAEGRTSRESFVNGSAWTTEYVGAGPYRLERWEPGLQLEGTAFEHHALGRAKIDRLIIRILVDENTTLATVLAGGHLDYTNESTMRFEHYATLKREWEPTGKGQAVLGLGTAVYLFLQQRPEYVGDPGLLDLRVRRALAHAIDRQALNEGLFEGLGIPTESPVPPDVPFYPAVDRLMAKYPLDLNRSAQLMAEAGYTRDSQGLYADGQGRQFHLDFAVQNSSEIERMQAILSRSWRDAGFDVRTTAMAVSLFTQQETRQTLPGLGYALFTAAEATFRSSEVGAPGNRWTGNNRSGWTNPGYDRVYGAW